jgi:hypothetical protein
MKGKRKLIWLTYILILAMIPIASPQTRAGSEDRDEDEAILVGRISYVKGRVLRYVPEEQEWVAIVKDTPFGLSDSLHSEKAARAEIIMPNNTLARIDGATEIRLIALREDLTEIQVDSGLARFYNKGFDAVIEARTPFGHVRAPGETTFDLYVDDESAEVVALKGTVYFVHKASGTRLEVIAGSSSVIADSRKVTPGEAQTARHWNAWNSERDALWAERMQVKGKSAEYLPPRLCHDSYILDECGRWERVYYNGGHYYFWRPLYVSAAWAPFTVGRWIIWCGDHTWIPREPFGYVTHHYGAWIFVRGFWYWAPPVCFVRIRTGPPFPPLFPFPFFWCPGRVAWIHCRGRVGWVPLAPGEVYHCHRRWGPRAVVVRNRNITNVNININGYKYRRHAVIIDKGDLYKVDNYRKIGITRVTDGSMLNEYRAVPVPNKWVVGNHGNTKQRYTVANIDEIRTTHGKAIEKIASDQRAGERGEKARPTTARESVGNMIRGRVSDGARVKPPEAKNSGLPVKRVNKSGSKGKLEEGPVKRRARLRGENREQVTGEVQKQRREIPPRPVNKGTVRRENQGQMSNEGRKQWGKIGSEPVRRQALPKGDRGLGASQLRENRGRVLPRSGQEFRNGGRGERGWRIPSSSGKRPARAL